jgi:hypothetical protein
LKVSVPVGNTVPWFGVTVTVKLTVWPNVDGLGLDCVIVLVVAAGLTVWLKSADVLTA